MAVPTPWISLWSIAKGKTSEYVWSKGDVVLVVVGGGEGPPAVSVKQ